MLDFVYLSLFKIIICNLILSTKVPQKPNNHLERIICDADLDYLGREDYIVNSNKFLQEIQLNKKISELEWLSIQDKFLRAHHYFTSRSINNREGKKQERLKMIQEQIKTIRNGTSRT